jgi:protein-arginine kinase activator protein McsA
MVKPRCFKCKQRIAIGITNAVPVNCNGNMEVLICDKCNYEWTDVYNNYINQLTWADRWAKFMGKKEVFIFR